MLNLDNIFSIEWFGIKKKEEELKMTIEDVRKSSKYNKFFLQLVTSTFKNAWNYKAYKLPKWESEDGCEGFEENIHLMNNSHYEAYDKISQSTRTTNSFNKKFKY